MKKKKSKEFDEEALDAVANKGRRTYRNRDEFSKTHMQTIQSKCATQVSPHGGVSSTSKSNMYSNDYIRV